MSIEMIQTEEFNQGTQIKVIGVGGGGGNAVEHMIQNHVQGVEFVCANTDAQALARSAAHRFVQLGQTGLGAGSKPEKGREAAELAEAEGHHPDLHLEGYRQVWIEIWTHAIGGLSENDFILAAKIDQLPVELKAPRKD